MPIKFRCQKCRQFLGISRTKAGQVVDCPTCGRSVRVPQLDGQVEPLPAPAMDMDDSSLVNALDALARIGEEPADDELAQADEPTVLDAPVVIESPTVPAAAVPITDPPSVLPTAVDPTSDTIELEPAPVVDSDKTQVLEPTQAGADTAFNSTLIQMAELTPLSGSDMAEVHPPPIASASANARWPRLAWVLVSCLAFGGGYVVRALLPLPSPPADANTDPRPAQASSVVSPGQDAAALRGRISYLNSDGQRQADHGARILVFAQEHPEVVTVSAIGLRSPPDGTDYQLTRAAWQSLGGDLAVADQQGEFQAALPGPGEYAVLVISHFAPRSSDLEPSDDLAKRLQQFVDRPDQLLGQLQYHYEIVRYSGTGTLTVDHTFR